MNEDRLLLDSEKILTIVKMVKIFSIYEFRKLACRKNANAHVYQIMNPKSSIEKGILYAKFHRWRNKVLQTGKVQLEERIKSYCLQERRKNKNSFTQDESLVLLGQHEQIKNAIWDLLNSKQASKNIIDVCCLFSIHIAKELNPCLQRTNENNLFFKKVDASKINTNIYIA